MRALSRLSKRLNNFGRRGHDARLKEEMDAHIAALTEENIKAGMAPSEALRQARLKFGTTETIREDYHAEARLPFLDTLLLDIRYALRVLRKSPTFTVVASVTLMLGIGANVVVFGVLNTVLLQPLPVKDPSSLYQVRPKPWRNGRLLTTSYPAFQDYRRRTTAFSAMAAVNGYSESELSRNGTVLREISGEGVTGNYFDLLGVAAAEGRVFHAGDEHGPDSAPLLVLSDALWHSTFHADPSVIGATIELDQHSFTVVGVMPPGFHGMEKFRLKDYWIPIVNEEQLHGDPEGYLHDRKSRLTVIGRLKPGVTVQQATDNLDAIAIELAKEYPATDDGQLLRLIHPGLFGDAGEVVSGFLWSVTALALLVLFAACANLATLFAARTADRTQELALRVALGSSRRRLVRQLLTEALLISLFGGAAALAGAYGLLGVLGRWQSPIGLVPVAGDARVYAAGLGFTLASALLFGLAPAQQVWQSGPLQNLRAGSAKVRRFALRDWLLGVQIAICTLLVTASLVAVRSTQRILHVPLGFKPQGATLVDLDLDSIGQAGDTTDARRKLLDAIRSIPGVTAVGRVDRMTMTGGLYGIPIFAPGTTEFTLPNAVLSPYVFTMTPGYLEAAGTRLLDGRDVAWQDTAKTPFVAVVNATFAQKMWGKTPAIGQRFILDGQLREVVGIVEDGKYHDLQESGQPVMYVPYAQRETSNGVFVVRSRRGPSEMASALAQALRGLVPEKSIAPQRWTDLLDYEVFPARAATTALGVMGSLAALLAVTGIFGMAAYTVSRRKKELGIRMALGARRMQVLEAAVGRPLMLLGMGSVVGLFAALLTGRVMELIVYQADPQDPVVLGGAVLMMVALGVVASALPARRALGIDPSRLMREE